MSKIGQHRAVGESNNVNVADANISATLVKRGNETNSADKNTWTPANKTLSKKELVADTKNDMAITIGTNKLTTPDLNENASHLFNIPEAPPLPATKQPTQNTNQIKLKTADVKVTDETLTKLSSLDNQVSTKHVASVKTAMDFEKEMNLIMTGDKAILSKTQYDNKPENTPVKDVSDEEIKSFISNYNTSSLAGSLDKVFGQSSSVLKKGGLVGEKITKDISGSSNPDMLLAIKLKSDTELKDIVAKSFGDLGKVSEKYEQTLAKHSEGSSKMNALLLLKEDVKNNKNLTKEQQKNLFVQLNTKIHKVNKDYGLIPENKIAKGPYLDNTTIEPLKLYDFLSPYKKALVDSIVNGMKNGLEDKVSNEKTTLKNKSDEFEMPSTLNLNGQEYKNPKYIAQGGLGAVFKYENDKGQSVIVKNLLDNTKREDMVTEIKNHVHAMGPTDTNEHIINLKGVIKGNENELYMVMETAKSDGEKTLDKISESNDISPNTKALLKTALLKDMMNGMLYVQNDRNMMHLDLKPGNYLINDDGKAVVSDFGSSKRDQSGFNTSNLEATVVYRSPEVVSKDRNADDKLVITEKSDIWTMGVVLHDVFYGPNRLEGKFSADTENNIYQFSKNENNKLIENEVTPVDTLINSMAHPNPEKRPTFEAILQSSVFSDNKLDKPELKQLVLELLKPNPDTNKVKELEGLINQ